VFRRRAGFTLVELLVVIAIVGVLTALLLPAVQQSREAARRSQCANKMKQLALGVQNFENVKKVYPPTMDFSQSALPFTTWSGQARILPYLEENNLYSFVSFNQPFNTLTMPDGSKLTSHRVDTFVCPDELDDTVRMTNGQIDSYPLNYALNSGPWPVYDPNNPIGGLGPFFCNSRVRPSQISDGLSRTLMLAEVKAYTPVYRTAPAAATIPAGPSDICALNATEHLLGPDRNSNIGHAEWVDGKVFQAAFTTAFAPNTQVLCNYQGRQYDVDLASNKEGSSKTAITYAAITSRSYHGSLVNVALMDGSVRAVSNDIDVVLWRALSTRAGAEIIGQDF
jgi:prepilin-type N-terminal cleavage/methylation domain-containing protein